MYLFTATLVDNRHTSVHEYPTLLPTYTELTFHIRTLCSSCGRNVRPPHQKMRATIATLLLVCMKVGRVETPLSGLICSKFPTHSELFPSITRVYYSNTTLIASIPARRFFYCCLAAALIHYLVGLDGPSLSHSPFGVFLSIQTTT